ncbi:MAG: glycosyltransferase family 39 protein [Chitinophagales bacterium]
MSAYLKDKKLIGLLLLTFLLRLTVFMIFQPWREEVLQKDVFIYDAIGYNILAKCLAFDFSFCGDTFRTPIYPAFAAFFYALFGAKPWVVLLVQVFLNTASGFLLFRICQRLFPNTVVGYAALFLFAFDPQQVIFSTYLYTDILFVFILLLSVLLLIKAMQENKIYLFILCGILSGILILTRPIAIYLPAVLGGFLLVWPKSNPVQRLKQAAILVVLAYLTIIPWMYRNYKLYQHFELSSINGYNLLFYNAAFTEVNLAKKTYEQVCNEFVQISKEAAPEKLKPEMPENMEERLHQLTFEKSDVYNQVAKKYLKTHFFAAVKAHLSGTVKLHLNMGSEVILQRLHIPVKRWSDTEKYSGSIFQLAEKYFNSKSAKEIVVGIFVLLFLGVVYFTALLGIIELVFMQRQWMVCLFILLIIAYFAGLSGIFYTPRFRLPFMPFYMLLSGVGYTFLLRRFKKY